MQRVTLPAMSRIGAVERGDHVDWSAWTKTAEQQQEGGTWDEAYDNGLALITNC